MLRYFVNKQEDEARVLMEVKLEQQKAGAPSKIREVFLVLKLAKEYCSLKIWRGSLLTTTDSWNMTEIKPDYHQRAYLAAKAYNELRHCAGLVEGAMFQMFAESLTRELDQSFDDMIHCIAGYKRDDFIRDYLEMADSDSSVTPGPAEMSSGEEKGNIDA